MPEVVRFAWYISAVEKEGVSPFFSHRKTTVLRRFFHMIGLLEYRQAVALSRTFPHLLLFSVAASSLVSIDPIRCSHSRRASRFSYGIPFVFCQHLLAHHMHGGTRINDKLCLSHGLMF